MVTRVVGEKFLLDSKWHKLAQNLNHSKQSVRWASNLVETVSDYERQHKQPLVKKTTAIPSSLYGGRHAVTVLPGSGIGPELMKYVTEIFRYSGAPIDLQEVSIDNNSPDSEFEDAVTAIKRNGVALKGNIETSSEDTNAISRNVAIRNELDLYANVLHCKSYPNVRSRHKNVDIIIIRQNTEGEYSMLEHESVAGLVSSLKIITRANSERLARFGFEYARRHGRKRVTTVHKANIMKLSDGLFLKVCKEVAAEYPEIEHNNMIIDNCCMQLVSNPHQFDVILTTNLYGTVVSNVLCGLVGGAGLLSGKNYGDHYAVFEPGTRNTGTAIAGKGIANPIAMINAATDLLEHVGNNQHAELIRNAVYKTICEDKIHTRDLGGDASSIDVVSRIIDHITKTNKVWYAQKPHTQKC